MKTWVRVNKSDKKKLKRGKYSYLSRALIDKNYNVKKHNYITVK
jgi:hypothetical protein